MGVTALVVIVAEEAALMWDLAELNVQTTRIFGLEWWQRWSG